MQEGQIVIGTVKTYAVSFLTIKLSILMLYLENTGVENLETFSNPPCSSLKVDNLKAYQCSCIFKKIK
jgi:hypothetical protein